MAARVRYPVHEARHPWLTGLLNAYHLADEAAREDLARETARRGRGPACGPGCTVCCVGQVVPVSAFEALGLWWFAAEILEGDQRGRLRANLEAREALEPGMGPCPFLVLSACAVYPLRPLLCRRHYVFGAPCRPGENLRMQRPGDVFEAGRDAARDLAAQIIPLYGVPEEDVDRRFETGYVSQRSRDLHSLPLENLIAHMDAGDKRKAETNA